MHQARTFGVLSPFVGGDYYGAIIAGINRAAASEGNRIIAFQTLDPGSHGADFSGVPEFRRPVAWRHLDGLIILPGAVHASYARAIQRADKPIVLVGHQLPDVECATALVDNRAGVRAAVAHLLDHGHERIAFGGDLTSFDLRERHEGYREALIEHGVAVRPELCFEAPDNHESGGETLAGKLIRADMPATAIVVGTDRNAIGLVRRLTAASRRVPGELAIVGFDDIADALYSRPSLSTVRQPLDHLGRAAHELVRDAAAGSPGPPAARKVATQFVPRESCGCPARGLQLSEEQMRAQFADNVYLQMTLNTQYELGIELLGSQEGDARGLSWLRCTPALGGCLGLWPDEPARTDASAAARSLAVGADSEIEIAGEYRTDGDPPASLGETMPVSAFPPLWLLALADGAAGQVAFVVPVRNESRDWGVLAAVGRIQDTTPPGREMMNHSGSLLAVALDRKAMHHSLQEKERSAIASAHYAGMAEIAIDVLHNVGNILASVKVTCTTLQHSLEASRADNLGRVAAMLQERAERGTGELAAFMSEDERGRKLVAYLAELSRLLERENHDALAEVGSLAGIHRAHRAGDRGPAGPYRRPVIDRGGRAVPRRERGAGPARARPGPKSHRGGEELPTGRARARAEDEAGTRALQAAPERRGRATQEVQRRPPGDRQHRRGRGRRRVHPDPGQRRRHPGREPEQDLRPRLFHPEGPPRIRPPLLRELDDRDGRPHHRRERRAGHRSRLRPDLRPRWLGSR